MVPAMLERAVLAPGAPHQVRVGIGEAKFLSFNCLGGPADVVITLSTYAERADPLLILSLNAQDRPNFEKHDASSFRQWREDDSGDHYVVAKGVSPEGGVLGLVNLRHFAAEELDGILSIQCTFIIAFDGLFWHHLRSTEVCPSGGAHKVGQVLQPASLCSGRGRCVDHGVCQCDGDAAGAACEHKKNDIVTAAEGRYRFALDTGHYQYLRVRVPSEFPGGYLEVKVWSDRPVVVLLRSDALPTKSNFETSNFDDWVNKRNNSRLRFQVPSSDGRSPLLMVPGRQLQETCAEPGPLLTSPACKTQGFLECQANCRHCVNCVKGKDGAECNQACENCVAPRCVETLGLCAGNVSCMGTEALHCAQRCGGCMACMDSNDGDCAKCHCCISCLPVAAKCKQLQPSVQEQDRYVFVGIYNHRRYFNDIHVVHAMTDVSLKLDPSYAQTELPSSWLADLYDPFADISGLVGALGEAQSPVYPQGEQFIYQIAPLSGRLLRQQVRIYRDRMTLLSIRAGAGAQLALKFGPGPNVTHVLVATNAPPKTLFDFDSAPTPVQGRPLNIIGGPLGAWVALFGEEGGYITVAIWSQEDSLQAVPVGFALVCVLGLLAVVLVLGAIYGSSQSIGERLGLDGLVPLGERLWCLVSRSNPHESTAALTRETSMSGFVSSDVIDRTVEDQYLHRGGMGDDGI